MTVKHKEKSSGKITFSEANKEFEKLKRETGYGYFTYDAKGQLTGVAFKAPDVLIPTNDKVG